MPVLHKRSIADYQRRARGPMPFLQSLEFTEIVSNWNAVNMNAKIATAANPYALQNDTLALLRSAVNDIRPRRLIEFGSGASTTVLGGWASENGSKLLSLEHDRGWAARMNREIQDGQLSGTSVIHDPLRPRFRGWRLFLTYRSLQERGESISEAEFMLLDGPHMSGREAVLRVALAHASPGAILVIDDFHHHVVREMLVGTPRATATCFEGVGLEVNSHGLYFLRCVKPAPPIQYPSTTLGQWARSYWRAWIDFRSHGFGN